MTTTTRSARPQPHAVVRAIHRRSFCTLATVSESGRPHSAGVLYDREITRLIADGHLRSITSHGELENPDGCFLRITPTGRINTYGLGMSLRQLLHDPLNAGGSIDLAG